MSQHNPADHTVLTHAGRPTLRLHAGLEDPDDLIRDLERGFARMAGERAA